MGHTILVLENDADLLGGIVDLLEGDGFSAVGALNGKEGLRMLGQIGTPRLILLDEVWRLRRGSHEFLERLMEEPATRGVPVVLMTGSADPLPPECVGRLSKPFSASALLKLVRAYRPTE